VYSLLETFPLVFEETDNKIDVDLKNAKVDMDLYKEVYPDYEILGWYATRLNISPGFIGAHNQIAPNLCSDFNDRPLFLLLDPVADPEAKELPMKLYEKLNDEFAPVPFQIESDEAERLTVVHCAKVVQDVQEDDVSSVQQPFSQIVKSLDSLNARVNLIARYLEDVKSGDTKADQGLLREIRGLCNRLPTMDTDGFKADYMREFNDSLLLTYLAAITKNSATANEVVSNFSKARTGVSQGGKTRDRDFGGLGGMMGGMFGAF